MTLPDATVQRERDRFVETATSKVATRVRVEEFASGLNLGISATDLDIRNLTSATDFVSAVQSGAWNITNISGTISLPTGAATSAKQLPDGHAVTVDNTTSSAVYVRPGTAAIFDVSAVQSGAWSVGIRDADGANQGVLMHDGLLGVVDVGHLIAAGFLADHQSFWKIGYNPNVTTTEEDIWSAGGTYVWPTAAMGMEVVSSDNTQDIGTVIKGDATGNTVQSDADGTATTIEDDSVDFTAATAVAVGDCVILDPHGDTPEYGFVTAVATNTLTIGGGFSEGGTGASRYYAVVDRSAYTNAQVVGIHYLDASYNRKVEIVVLNGTTVVPTINTDIFRINDFEVAATGTGCKTLGNISLRNLADTPVYNYITAGYNIARNLFFTVPDGFSAYITGINVAASTPNDSKIQTARIILKVAANPHHEFNSYCVFYPYAETVISNGVENIVFTTPIKIPEKTDVIVSGQGFTGFSGPITSIARGYLSPNT